MRNSFFIEMGAVLSLIDQFKFLNYLLQMFLMCLFVLMSVRMHRSIPASKKLGPISPHVAMWRSCYVLKVCGEFYVKFEKYEQKQECEHNLAAFQLFKTHVFKNVAFLVSH